MAQAKRKNTTAARRSRPSTVQMLCTQILATGEAHRKASWIICERKTYRRIADAAASFDIRTISAKRRDKSNPWFKRGTQFRSAVDVLRRAQASMTARASRVSRLANSTPRKFEIRRPILIEFSL
jgi:hypothetical protein